MNKKRRLKLANDELKVKNDIKYIMDSYDGEQVWIEFCIAVVYLLKVIVYGLFDEDKGSALRRLDIYIKWMKEKNIDINHYVEKAIEQSIQYHSVDDETANSWRVDLIEELNKHL